MIYYNMKASEELKLDIAKKVVESMGDTMLEETEHYMFLSGLYDETDNEYMRDQADIIKKVAKLLLT
jgi:hypothetical protein